MNISSDFLHDSWKHRSKAKKYCPNCNHASSLQVPYCPMCRYGEKEQAMQEKTITEWNSTIPTSSKIVTNEQGGSQSFIEADFDCIPPEVLKLLAECLGFGARKYGKFNWKKIPIEDNLSHALNHINEWRRRDRSEPHLVNAMARLTFALWHAVNSGNQPDRYIHPDMAKDEWAHNTAIPQEPSRVTDSSLLTGYNIVDEAYKVLEHCKEACCKFEITKDVGQKTCKVRISNARYSINIEFDRDWNSETRKSAEEPTDTQIATDNKSVPKYECGSASASPEKGASMAENMQSKTAVPPYAPVKTEFEVRLEKVEEEQRNHVKTLDTLCDRLDGHDNSLKFQRERLARIEKSVSKLQEQIHKIGEDLQTQTQSLAKVWDSITITQRAMDRMSDGINATINKNKQEVDYRINVVCDNLRGVEALAKDNVNSLDNLFKEIKRLRIEEKANVEAHDDLYNRLNVATIPSNFAKDLEQAKQGIQSLWNHYESLAKRVAAIESVDDEEKQWALGKLEVKIDNLNERINKHYVMINDLDRLLRTTHPE